MSNMNIQNYGQDKEIVQGDGFYESGKVTIAANGEVVQGDLLARDRGGSGTAVYPRRRDGAGHDGGAGLRRSEIY